MKEKNPFIELGKIIGVWGVNGWVKVFSHTNPRNNIIHYKHWYLKQDDTWQKFRLSQGRIQGKKIVTQLLGVQCCDEAEKLKDAVIAIKKQQLTILPDNEYYWTELEGLQVFNLSNMCLGLVQYLIETGANDVLVVRGNREYLIPYIPDVIHEIDLNNNKICVDWDPDF